MWWKPSAGGWQQPIFKARKQKTFLPGSDLWYTIVRTERRCAAMAGYAETVAYWQSFPIKTVSDLEQLSLIHILMLLAREEKV